MHLHIWRSDCIRRLLSRWLKQAESNRRRSGIRIENSTYSERYKILITDTTPQYFHIPTKERKLLACWRFGNKEKRFIRKECGRCSSTDLSLEHGLLCNNLDISASNLLKEDGSGVGYLRLIS